MFIIQNISILSSSMPIPRLNYENWYSSASKFNTIAASTLKSSDLYQLVLHCMKRFQFSHLPYAFRGLIKIGNERAWYPLPAKNTSSRNRYTGPGQTPDRVDGIQFFDQKQTVLRCIDIYISSRTMNFRKGSEREAYIVSPNVKRWYTFIENICSPRARLNFNLAI